MLPPLFLTTHTIAQDSDRTATVEDKLAEHSLLRQQMLILSRPVDNAPNADVVVDSNFSLNATIFKTLSPCSLNAFVQRAVLDTRLKWHPEVEHKVRQTYAQLPPVVAEQPNLLRPVLLFMHNECNFAMEHAEGSFMDHLRFCSEYSQRYLSGVSPKILLLHSIMGVGTNMFPMAASKIPTLQSLLTKEEFLHVQAFPSMLRLIIHGPLLRALPRRPEAWHAVQGLHLHRLIDNKRLYLTKNQLVVQLNLQLVHALDFMPAAAWKRTQNQYFVRILSDLYWLLKDSGNLQVRISWRDEWLQEHDMQPPSWRHWLVGLVPGYVIRAAASRQIASYSRDVGHSLAFVLV